MEIAKIINPGLFTTLQDSGRFGFESLGVPTSGAMDEFAFKVANILVGNKASESVLEITLLGPTIEFLDECLISVTGANMQPKLNDRLQPNWSSFQVEKGDILSFSPVKEGCRVYLAVAGGFKAREVMGSTSTYLRGKIGGIDGRPLKKGDILEIKTKVSDAKPYRVKKEYIPSYESSVKVRIILGPQDDYFSTDAIDKFLSSTYEVTKDSDRMGFRLEGPAITPNKYDIITDGLIPGAIQIPGNGKPIIMMKDAQTTGGYVKIANVISSDLSKLAQLKPGDKISFELIELETAHEILREKEGLLEKIKEGLMEVDYRHFHIKVDGISYEVILEEI